VYSYYLKHLNKENYMVLSYYLKHLNKENYMVLGYLKHLNSTSFKTIQN